MNEGHIQPGALALTLAHETLWLLPERALWWPAAHTLFVADVHLGKAASFRALGLPVPAGTTDDNLQRLSRLIEALGATRLVVLGDLLHARAAQRPELIAALRQWRERHASLDCLLIRGNHDMHAGDPPASLLIQTLDEPQQLGPFAACHHPSLSSGAIVLAGHLHPAVNLHGRANEHHRLPCFCMTEALLILPAFGAFTGTTTAALPTGATCYAIGGGRVWAVPP